MRGSFAIIKKLSIFILYKLEMYNLLHFFEKNGFYVASRLADRLGMRATQVRLFSYTFLLLQWVWDLVFI